MGADVMLCGPLPTPGIAFITSSMRADAGVVISASHNPFQDNGIKIFAADGYKLPDSVESELEALMDGTELDEHRPLGTDLGKATKIVDEHGDEVDGDTIMAICARRLLERRELKKNTVVATVMSNLGLERSIAGLGGTLVRAQVGDRYVVEEMRSNGYNFGGEQSGHL